MIIWLASYPKSGNTYLRSMLSAYLFSENGKFNFDLLKNINQFPNYYLFRKLGFDVTDELNVIKNYINIQEKINKLDAKKLRILKTHSSLHSINGYSFTNLKNSLGVIYIVRDPRKVIISYANHSQKSFDEIFKIISQKSIFGGKNDLLNITRIHGGSWSSNYQSWKEFKKFNRYLLIKYEDLIKNPQKIFIDVLNFIELISKSKIPINDLKLNNTIDSTSFNKMQKLESNEEFTESLPFAKNNKRVKFFKYGPNNDGKKLLPKNLRLKIEELFKEEMEELGYL